MKLLDTRSHFSKISSETKISSTKKVFKNVKNFKLKSTIKLHTFMYISSRQIIMLYGHPPKYTQFNCRGSKG